MARRCHLLIRFGDTVAPTVTLEVEATATRMASQTEAVTVVQPTVTVEEEVMEEEVTEEEQALAVQVATKCRI